MLLDTHDWKSEPMILVSLGQLIEKLGLDKTQAPILLRPTDVAAGAERLAGEAHALRKAEKPLDRLQSEVMSVSERLTLFANVMDGSAFLLVPAPEKTTDPWLVPPAFGQHYDAAQFAPVANAVADARDRVHAKGDGFQFSRAANQLRDGLRALSPKIYPAESQLRLEYFYNHFDGFYRAAWCYGIALGLARRCAICAAKARAGEMARRRCIALLGLLFHASGHHDALPDRGPPAGDEHV